VLPSPLFAEYRELGLSGPEEAKWHRKNRGPVGPQPVFQELFLVAGYPPARSLAPSYALSRFASANAASRSAPRRSRMRFRDHGEGLSSWSSTSV
jgi:hypothetical protein